MEYADRGNLADALRSGRFPSHDFIAVYRCLLDIAAGVARRSCYVLGLSGYVHCCHAQVQACHLACVLLAGGPSLCKPGKMMIALIAGVDYLHTADMIHGDLKSANVLLKSTGTDARGFTCKVSLPVYSAPSTAGMEDCTLTALCVALVLLMAQQFRAACTCKRRHFLQQLIMYSSESITLDFDIMHDRHQQ